MKRATRRRLGLSLGVAALLALAGWQWQSDLRAAPGTLLATLPASIGRIELRLGTAPLQRFERRADGHWQRADDASAHADDQWLDGLADTAAAPVLRWLPSGELDPARIGLQPPRAVLSLDGQALEFGEVSATGPQAYVRVGERIALVPLRYLPRPAQADALHAR